MKTSVQHLPTEQLVALCDLQILNATNNGKNQTCALVIKKPMTSTQVIKYFTKLKKAIQIYNYKWVNSSILDPFVISIFATSTNNLSFKNQLQQQ